MNLGYDPGPKEAEIQMELLQEIVRKTVSDAEISKFDEMDSKIRRLRRLDLSTYAKAGALELQLYRELKGDRLRRAVMKEQVFWENLN